MDFIRTALQPSDLDVVLMVAGKAKDREIYASLNQYPAEGKRLLVVRDAEKIKRWEPFADWQQESRLMPSSYVVFVSGESDFDTERPVHRLIVDKNGSMIRCAPPPDEVAVQWIQKRHEMHSDVALYLLERVGGGLALAGQTALKLGFFPVAPSCDLIDALVADSPSTSFVDSLIANKPQRALVALDELAESEYSKALGLLESRLDAMAKVYRAVARGQTPRDIAQSKIVPQFMVRLLYPHAKAYDVKVIHRRRGVLCLVDSHFRDGARIGIMEALCALW